MSIIPPPQLYRIREGKLDTWRSWCYKLATTYNNESAKIIDDEGLIAEFFIDFTLNDTWYTLGAMIPSTDIAITVNSDANNNLNAIHRQKLRECLVKVSPAEYGYLIRSSKA